MKRRSRIDLVDRLIDLGHRNIGIAAIDTKSHTDYPGWQGIVGRRMASVVRALKKHNLSPEDKEITVIETPCTYRGGADVFNKCGMILISNTDLLRLCRLVTLLR